MSQQEGSPTGTPAVPTMTGMRRGGLTSARQSCASWGRPHEEPDLPTQSGATSCWDPHAPMGPARVEIARDQEESWDTRNIIQCSPACSPADLQTHPCPTGLLCHPNKTCPALQDDLSTQKQTAGRRGKGHSPPPRPSSRAPSHPSTAQHPAADNHCGAARAVGPAEGDPEDAVPDELCGAIHGFILSS